MARLIPGLVAVAACLGVVAQSAGATGFDVDAVRGHTVSISTGHATVTDCGGRPVVQFVASSVDGVQLVDHLLIGDDALRAACAGSAVTAAVTTVHGVIETAPVLITAGNGPVEAPMHEAVVVADVLSVAALVTRPTIEVDMTAGGES